ncbi:MAG: C_GCAxxG_C_C family protein, partial [Gammaproteobacteria bacterium]|nr:C_GCAxxG_C_C family protein [Gammaproteobacteria bacterium]
MSRTCNMCGALTGGILALNVVFGRNSSDDSVEKNYKAVQNLVLDFENEFGSSNCQELLGCNLGDNEGQKKFHEHELHLQCCEYTGKATELVRAIIDNEKP